MPHALWACGRFCIFSVKRGPSHGQPQTVLMWLMPWPIPYLIVAVKTHPPFRPTISSVPFCHLPAAYLVKMLPFPVFFLLIFSATLLAPAPAVLIDFLRTLTIQSSEWDTLPVSISSSTFSVSSSETPSFLALLPQASLDVSPTCCAPSFICIASNNAISPSHAYTTDDRTTSTAVLFVVALAMVNCLVWVSLYPVTVY